MIDTPDVDEVAALRVRIGDLEGAASMAVSALSQAREALEMLNGIVSAESLLREAKEATGEFSPEANARYARLRASADEQRISELRGENDTLRAEVKKLRRRAVIDEIMSRHDNLFARLADEWHEHRLLDTLAATCNERDALRVKVAELEAENHKLLCAGAFSIDRDPMKLRHVLLALQYGGISVSKAMDCVRRWLAGLPVELDDTAAAGEDTKRGVDER